MRSSSLIGNAVFSLSTSLLVDLYVALILFRCPGHPLGESFALIVGFSLRFGFQGCNSLVHDHEGV